MIKVIRATKKHTRDIENLLLECGKFRFDGARINNRDLSFVALDRGSVVGFLWVGLMANRTFGYLDQYAVSPNCRLKGVAKALGAKALSVCSSIGVRQLFGIIKHDEYHLASGSNAIKIGGAGIDPVSYSLVQRRLC